VIAAVRQEIAARDAGRRRATRARQRGSAEASSIQNPKHLPRDPLTIGRMFTPAGQAPYIVRAVVGA